MNKNLLHIKLEKLLPADDVADLCDAIMSSPNADKIVDVVFDKGKITCVKLPWSPRENLKRAVRYYLESSCPMEMTTYTTLKNQARDCKKDFDKIVIEALGEIISDLEE